MCWKYEDSYDTCFDHIEWEDDNQSILGVLNLQYNMEVVDKGAFRTVMYAAFSELHESGAIKPKIEPKGVDGGD